MVAKIARVANGLSPARFNTSEPHPKHEKFPYWLRKLEIERPNQVWATDITYTAIVGHRAFVIAIVDLFSRKVMAYSVVNTTDAFHCVETLQMAVNAFGAPEIFNSDQGSQFTNAELIYELREYGDQNRHGWSRTLPGQCKNGAVLVGAQV